MKIKYYLQLLRPKQWIKNGFVIAPIFFAHKFTDFSAWIVILSAAFAFAFAASAVYIINDIVDRKEDAKHPGKRLRPLAAQLISVPQALFIMALCIMLSLAALYTLPSICAELIALYLAANILYTLIFKKQALLDVFFIASCFVLRVLTGCYALSVMVSPWIILTTFMLALFLGFGKRYHEIGIADYAESKQNLQNYSKELLDKLVIICGTASLVCYAIYTAEMSSGGDVRIVYTVAFVAFGLFRYLQTIYVYGEGGEPESIALKDKWQLLNIAAWLFFTLYIFTT